MILQKHLPKEEGIEFISSTFIARFSIIWLSQNFLLLLQIDVSSAAELKEYSMYFPSGDKLAEKAIRRRQDFFNSKYFLHTYTFFTHRRQLYCDCPNVILPNVERGCQVEGEVDHRNYCQDDELDKADKHLIHCRHDHYQKYVQENVLKQY